MDEKNTITTDQKEKRLIVRRLGDTNDYNAHHNQEELAQDPDYEYGAHGFLYDLFLSITDFGHFMPMFLEDKSTDFGGNGNWGKIIGNNRITFGDHFDDVTHEMDFDEFLSINDKYQKLSNLKPDAIIFGRIGEKVTLEGLWLEKDNLDAPKNINQ